MSELERKPREADVEAQKTHQRDAAEAPEKHATRSDPKDEAKDAASAAVVMPWDADLEHLMDRLDLFVRDLRASMGMTEFRSLVHSYRELSPMGRRAVANKLQQRRLAALLRALHAGDYALYQDTWKSDVTAREKAERSRESEARSVKMNEGD
ncbi:MAG: hypothetical protein ABI321_08720 [Polyangia bacterium]